MPLKPKKINKIKAEVHNEHTLQKAIVKKLRAHQFIVACNDCFSGMQFLSSIAKKAMYKTYMIGMGATVGFPDITIINPKTTKITFVEFKWGRNKKSPEQVFQCEQLALLGFEVLEWRTVEEAQQWVVKEIGI